MDYLLIQGDAEELIKSLNTFLADGWKLHGTTFATGKKVWVEATGTVHSAGFVGNWITEFAQAIIKNNKEQ